MRCPSCATENNVGVKNCANCGMSLTADVRQNPVGVEIDQPNMGINILSLCCIPILGIIMFFVWKDSKPDAAKSALIFGLIGIGVTVLLYVLFFAFGVLSMFSTA